MKKGKILLWSFAAGIAVTAGGLVFAAWFGSLINGFSRESSTIMGMLSFLCLVLVVCTGVILANLRGK